MILGEVRDKLEAFLRQAHDALLQFDPPLSGPQRKAELMRYVKEDKGFLAVFTQAAGRENPTEADYAEIEKIVDSLVRSSPTPAAQAPSPAPQQTGFGAQVLQALPGVAETVLSTAVAGDPWIGEAVTLGEAVAPLVIEGFRRCRLFNGGRGRGRAYVMEY
jgi:hypothetical protein